MGNLVAHAVDSGFLLPKTGKIALVLVLLGMALLIKEPVLVKSFVYKVFREAVKVQMNWQTRNWNEIEGAHFLIRYQSQDSNIAEMVLSEAEKSYAPVSKQFGYSPAGKIQVVIYPTKESLGRSFGWAADESAMGVYWAGVIRVLSPNVWVGEEDPQRLKETFATEGPMVHELTHLMVDYLTGGNYTRWFTEGIAQYEEAKLTGFQMAYREIGHPDELYPFALMDREFDNLGDESLAYFQSFQAVNYLAERYGEERIREILQSLGKGYGMEKSFRGVLGISMDQFEKDFKMWLLRNH